MVVRMSTPRLESEPTKNKLKNVFVSTVDDRRGRQNVRLTYYATSPNKERAPVAAPRRAVVVRRDADSISNSSVHPLKASLSLRPSRYTKPIIYPDIIRLPAITWAT